MTNVSKFERWCVAQRLPIEKTFGGEYANRETREAWIGWQNAYGPEGPPEPK